MTEKKESIVQFSNRLKSIVHSGSGRDFAKKAGIGYSTFHNYLQAISSPTLENLVLLAKAGGVSVEWLATGKEFTISSSKRHNEKTIEVPFIDHKKYLLLDSTIFPAFKGKIENFAAVHVDTDVMDPTFLSGSILLIDRSQQQLIDGKVIVLRKGDSCLFKRVQVISDGYCLSSDNKKYNDIMVKESSMSAFEVLGQAVAVLNNL
ncbi:LexA family transcriptional regulator [Rouxiella badensis]|uniref:LexA family transcriptional regulator n=1 Tax=Rouxiella badensis TaxID=1646377 RepID=UPI0022AA2587|nr:LexA family transcriptional regulator [Rouxiella badensis]WAT08860.1 LexA family transcriptional regulator [Rouxiella badensis]